MLNEEKEVLNYVTQAFSLRSKKLYKQAVEMLYKALTLDNDNLEILFQLGELYYLMNNFSRATGYFEEVLAKNSEHLESLKMLRKIYFLQNDFELSKDFAKRIFDLEPDGNNLYEYAKTLSKTNSLEELKSLQNSEFCNLKILCEIANTLFAKGKSAEAKALLENIPEKNEEINILLGKIYFDLKDFEASRKIFSQFPKMTDNTDILNYRGLFALEDMDFTEAIKCFSKASSICKKPVYFYNLGNAYFFNGWMKEAQNAYAKAIYEAPDNVDYRYSLAYLYYETEEFEKCKKEVEAILSFDSSHLHTRVLKALLCNQQMDYSTSKSILEENLVTNPKDEFTLISLAKTYICLDMFEKAEKIIMQIVSENPENLNYLADLADVYIQEKKFDESLKLVDKIISINPNYVYGYVTGAKTAYLSGDFEKAKEYAQEVLALDMNCSAGYYYLAMVRFNEKDLDEAIECMKRAILYDANNPLYYAEMSKIYREKEDYKTAFEYISEAESIDNREEYRIMYKELARLVNK